MPAPAILEPSLRIEEDRYNDAGQAISEVNAGMPTMPMENAGTNPPLPTTPVPAVWLPEPGPRRSNVPCFLLSLNFKGNQIHLRTVEQYALNSLPKIDIKESTVSLLPEGSLEGLSPGGVMNLFAYFQGNGPIAPKNAAPSVAP